MRESNNKLDKTEDITNLASVVEFIDYTYNMHIEWAYYLPADKWMLASVISSYLANLESPEDLLKASKATLCDLVKAEYIEYVSQLDDEEDKAEAMQLIS
jgi:hypothetical protein